MTQKAINGSHAPEVNIVRLFNVTRERLFRAWTDPAELARWWGPEGFTNPVCELDVRPGGNIYIHMQAPDGTVYPMGGTYHKINEPTLLVFSGTALDENGNAYLEDLNTVTFTEENGQTRLSVHAVITHAEPQAKESIEGMDEGWNQSIDKLYRLLDN